MDLTYLDKCGGTFPSFFGVNTGERWPTPWQIPPQPDPAPLEGKIPNCPRVEKAPGRVHGRTFDESSLYQ